MKKQVFGLLVVLAAFLAPLPLSAAEVNGFGTDIPLSFALRQIVPSQYEVSFAPGTDADAHVTWKGRGPWRTVLGNFAAANGLEATVIGRSVRISALEKRESPVAADERSSPSTPAGGDSGGFLLVPYRTSKVADASISEETASEQAPAPSAVSTSALTKPQSITPPISVAAVPPTVPANASKPTGLSPKEAPLSAPVSMAPIPSGTEVSTAVPAAPAVPATNSSQSAPIALSASSAPAAFPDGSADHKFWSAKEGSDLQDTLYEWAKNGGWTLVWKSDYQYPIEAPASFEGDFLTASTALFKSIRATPPLYPTFFNGNHVLVVSNAKDDTR